MKNTGRERAVFGRCRTAKGDIYRSEAGEICCRGEGSELMEQARRNFYRGKEENLRLLGQNPEKVSGNLNSFQAYGIFYSVLAVHGGNDLESVLRDRQEVWTLKETAEVIFKILEAAECFHRNKILHLDISPDNILFVEEQALLIDYNSVWLMDEEEESFLERDIQMEDGNTYPGKACEESLKKGGHILLRGSAGMGKTRFLTEIWKKSVEQYHPSEPVTVYIPLNDYQTAGTESFYIRKYLVRQLCFPGQFWHLEEVVQELDHLEKCMNKDGLSYTEREEVVMLYQKYLEACVEVTYRELHLILIQLDEESSSELLKMVSEIAVIKDYIRIYSDEETDVGTLEQELKTTRDYMKNCMDGMKQWNYEINITDRQQILDWLLSFSSVYTEWKDERDVVEARMNTWQDQLDETNSAGAVSVGES